MTRKQIVSSWGAAATLGLLLVATPRVSAQEPPKGFDGPREALSATVAARFAAMERLSARFNTPEAAGKLLDVLVARDAKAFNSLFGDLDLPLGGTCWWVHEIVEQAFRVEESKERECTLKENMTAAERALYIQIALKHGQLVPVASASSSSTPVLNALQLVVIPPGAFRDELEANALVDCKPVQGSTGLAARPIVGKPFYFCLEDGPRP